MQIIWMKFQQTNYMKDCWHMDYLLRNYRQYLHQKHFINIVKIVRVYFHEDRMISYIMKP